MTIETYILNRAIHSIIYSKQTHVCPVLGAVNIWVSELKISPIDILGLIIVSTHS